MERCVFCNFVGKFEPATTTEEAVIGERTFTADVAAERCPSCSEVYTPAGGPMAFGEALARQLIADGDVSGAAFRHLRYTLEMTGQALAETLGVTPETVSRWERGGRPVDRLAWATVATIVLEALEAPGVAQGRMAGVLAACAGDRGPLAPAVRFNLLAG